MKRLTYISRLSDPLSEKDIQEIGIVSAGNNQSENITGALVYFSGLFFQIIEGDDDNIDRLYEKIMQDKRHTDIICLKAEYDVSERLFPYWSMKTINLDGNNDVLIRPIKILLQSVSESHRIIEQYTQPAVIKILNKGINPLTIPARKTEKIILFADIMSYSALSEKLSDNDLMMIINRYLTICCEVISFRGGEVNKFIGDCVMAYFDSDQADNAIHTCIEILEKLKNIRCFSDESSAFRLLYCGFGLSQGLVIEGNMGSHVKTDYTIIGDAVNTAARLEALTREVKHHLVLSEKVRRTARQNWKFILLGKYDLKGKEKAEEVYSIDNEFIKNFKEKDALRHEIHAFSLHKSIDSRREDGGDC